MYQVPPSSPYVPCPRCQNPLPNKVTMSWWGGIVGPKMVNLVKCPQCKLQYNGKTGASVSKFIRNAAEHPAPRPTWWVPRVGCMRASSDEE